MEQPVDLADLYGGWWGRHPHYPVDEWKHEVEEGNTRYSYWEWVATCIDADQQSKEPDDET